MLQLCISVSSKNTVSVGCKSIGTPAQPTQPSMRALVRSSCRHLCEQHGSNSGSNPSRIDREPPCCSWAFLRLLHRLGGLQVHRDTCASYAHLRACARQSQLFLFIRAACVEILGQSVQNWLRSSTTSRPTRCAVGSHSGASEDVHLSAESEHYEHFGEPGDPC